VIGWRRPVSLAAGISVEKIQSGLQTYRPVIGRLNRSRIGQLTLIDDTYNANPLSMLAAIKVLVADTDNTLIIGDMAELGDAAETEHVLLGQRAAELGVSNLLVCGNFAHMVVDSFKQYSKTTEKNAMAFASQSELIKYATAHISSGTVLVKGSRSAAMECVVKLLSEQYSFFSVFQYITLRAICAVLTALTLSLVLGPFMIRKLSRHQIGQTVRQDGPPTHFDKVGTPTMGGLLILATVIFSTILWADLTNRFVLITLLVCSLFGVIGWYDDYQKLINKDPRGMGSRNKFLSQSVVALIAAFYLQYTATLPIETSLIIPFFKDVIWPLGILFVPLTYFVIVGTSNAVNLTDGLDGLAIVPTAMVAGALAVFCYLSGHAEFSAYLAIPRIPGAGEVAIFCAALVGAGLGFLWFNTYPAQVFMGDIGSLSLGASLGVVAVIVRQELVLFIMGGIFVLETVSVIIQVFSFKMFGKRVFRMAPIHHHFELKGWPEPRVIVRFWIISLILVLIGLATLKLR